MKFSCNAVKEDYIEITEVQHDDQHRIEFKTKDTTARIYKGKEKDDYAEVHLLPAQVENLIDHLRKLLDGTVVEPSETACEDCGTEFDVKDTTCPYQFGVNSEEVAVRLCSTCHHNRADDI